MEFTPILPNDPAIRTATQAVGSLRVVCPQAMSNADREAECEAAFSAVRSALLNPEVSAKVKTCVDDLAHAPGALPSVGVDILGRVDLNDLKPDDLERGLSLSLGLDDDEYRAHFTVARKTLRRLAREKADFHLHHNELLLRLLDHAYDAYREECKAREKKSSGKNRRARWRHRGLRRARAHATVGGCLYAIGILVANTDFGESYFARSYFISTGVSYARAPEVSLPG